MDVGRGMGSQYPQGEANDGPSLGHPNSKNPFILSQVFNGVVKVRTLSKVEKG